MATDINVRFSNRFLGNVRYYFPKTDPKELEVYIKERLSMGMDKLNSMENRIHTKRVCFDANPDCPEMSIDIDKAYPNYETAYLQVSTVITEPSYQPSSKNLIDELKFRDKHRDQKTFSMQNFLHELGHLQDVQRSGFYYTPIDKELVDYIDIVWNVLDLPP